MSTVVERLLDSLCVLCLGRSGAHGPLPFAYQQEGGAVDVILYTILFWLVALSLGKMFALRWADLRGQRTRQFRCSSTQ
eukprot:8877728-Pyramimonas_sp.AAC.1